MKIIETIKTNTEKESTKKEQIEYQLYAIFIKY